MIKKIILLISIIMFLYSCNNSGSDSSVSNIVTVNSNLLPTGSGKQTYLLLTNPTESNLPVPYITVNSESRDISMNNTRNASSDSESYTPPKSVEKHFEMPSRDEESSNRATVNPISYDNFNVGDSHSFFLLNSSDETYEESLKLKSRTALNDDVDLFIWTDFADQDIPNGSIEYLEGEFLKIFLLETTMYGEHWGKTSYDYLLNETNKDIHIFLTDIDGDKNIASALLYGYFYGADALQDYESSNQCLNIVIDCFSYFNGPYNAADKLDPNFSWSSDGFYCATTLSTLIHEFQHMIHFYNKYGQNGNNEYFFNEMFSMVTEEILAEEFLQYTYDGSTYTLNPDKERLPHFNFFWDLKSSFHWGNPSNSLELLTQYSMAYTMGAYLIRNYGFELFYSYLKSSNNGIDGILEALDDVDSINYHLKSNLLQNFGEAILSASFSENSMQVPYKFNNSKAIVIGDSTYNLKALDIFNEDEYTYYASGTESNRLLDYDYKAGSYHAAFYALDLEELNGNSRSSNRNFLSESNIYVDLGVLSQNDEIDIEFYTENIGIEYKFIH